MRELISTGPYERDLKKISRSGKCTFADIETVTNMLREDTPLPENLRDHALAGAWKKIDARECHVKPDVLLVYSKPEGELHLLRIASHSELFG